MGISRELLHGRWLHAHEEDTEDEMVFRPASADLPPSRGRRGLELNPDGTYAEIRPGADDRPEKASGEWGVEDEEWLVVQTDAGASRRMPIVAADRDRLVVRKPRRE